MWSPALPCWGDLADGYLGGATATHVRIGDPFFAPVILGVLVWEDFSCGMSACAHWFLGEASSRHVLPVNKIRSPN